MGRAGERPPVPLNIIGDFGGGALFLAFGILAGVLEARRSGKGQEVDVAIYEAVAALMESSMADLELGGVLRGRTGSVLPGVAPSNVYPTEDDSDIVIAANADTVFVRLCAAMGQPELATDDRYARHAARGANAADLDKQISQWTSARSAAEVLRVLDEHGVPAGQIFTARDMLTDPHYLAREMVTRLRSTQGWDVPMTGVVPKFSGTPGKLRRAGPALGADTADVLRDVAGLTDVEIDELRIAGLLEQR
jgi:formyl-CoA transferase/succinyl-CoA--D-citramalate CoA-transferase